MLIDAFKRQYAHETVRPRVSSFPHLLIRNPAPPVSHHAASLLPLQTLNRTKEHLQREMDKQRTAEHEVAQLRARQGFVHDLAVLELLLVVLEHAKAVEELGHVKADWNGFKVRRVVTDDRALTGCHTRRTSTSSRRRTNRSKRVTSEFPSRNTTLSGN